MTINQDNSKKRFENISEFREEFVKKISNSKRAILFFHKSPDFDSVGSNYGITSFLTSVNQHIEIIIISSDPVAKNISEFIKKNSNIEVQFQDPSTFDYKQGDLVISIDFTEITRASRNPDFKIPEFVDQVIIDHHVIPPVEDRTNYISTSNISSATIIYKIYKDAEIKIPQNCFEFIIFGLLGDSGLLRFKDKNFTDSLNIIQDFCKEYGTDGYFEIIEGIEANKPPEELALQSIFLKNLKFNKENKYMYTTITLKERRQAGIPDNYADITNGATLIRNYEGSLFTFSISEDKIEENKFNISFRSCTGSNFEVRKIAEKLGGGGHISAAGAQISAINIDEAIKKVENSITEK